MDFRPPKHKFGIVASDVGSLLEQFEQASQNVESSSQDEDESSPCIPLQLSPLPDVRRLFERTRTANVTDEAHTAKVVSRIKATNKRKATIALPYPELSERPHALSGASIKLTKILKRRHNKPSGFGLTDFILPAEQRDVSLSAGNSPRRYHAHALSSDHNYCVNDGGDAGGDSNSGTRGDATTDVCRSSKTPGVTVTLSNKETAVSDKIVVKIVDDTEGTFIQRNALDKLIDKQTSPTFSVGTGHDGAPPQITRLTHLGQSKSCPNSPNSAHFLRLQKLTEDMAAIRCSALTKPLANDSSIPGQVKGVRPPPVVHGHVTDSDVSKARIEKESVRLKGSATCVRMKNSSYASYAKTKLFDNRECAETSNAPNRLVKRKSACELQRRNISPSQAVMDSLCGTSDSGDTCVVAVDAGTIVPRRRDEKQYLSETDAKRSTETASLFASKANRAASVSCKDPLALLTQFVGDDVELSDTECYPTQNPEIRVQSNDETGDINEESVQNLPRVGSIPESGAESVVSHAIGKADDHDAVTDDSGFICGDGVFDPDDPSVELDLISAVSDGSVMCAVGSVSDESVSGQEEPNGQDALLDCIEGEQDVDSKESIESFPDVLTDDTPELLEDLNGNSTGGGCDPSEVLSNETTTERGGGGSLLDATPDSCMDSLELFADMEDFEEYENHVQNLRDIAEFNKIFDKKLNAAVNFKKQQPKEGRVFRKSNRKSDQSGSRELFDKLPSYLRSNFDVKDKKTVARRCAASSAISPECKAVVNNLPANLLATSVAGQNAFEASSNASSHNLTLNKVPSYLCCFTNSSKYDKNDLGDKHGVAMDEIEADGDTKKRGQGNRRDDEVTATSTGQNGEGHGSQTRSKRELTRRGDELVDGERRNSGDSGISVARGSPAFRSSRSRDSRSRSRSSQLSVASRVSNRSRSRQTLSRSRSRPASESSRHLPRSGSRRQSRDSSRSPSKPGSRSNSRIRSRSYYMRNRNYASRSRSRSRSGARYSSRYRSRSPRRSPDQRRESEVRIQRRFDNDRRMQRYAHHKNDELRKNEQRKIVYVGGVPDTFTRESLRKRFVVFGEIEDARLFFRDQGDNYGFVTFRYRCDAFAAIEKGNQGELVKLDLCFGGRRHFCETGYLDLDNKEEEYDDSGAGPQRDGGELDFDALLRKAQAR